VTAGVRVTIEHARAAGLCSTGSRSLAKALGLDWSQFLAEGIDADELERLAGGLAERAIRIAREEAAARGQ